MPWDRISGWHAAGFWMRRTVLLVLVLIAGKGVCEEAAVPVLVEWVQVAPWLASVAGGDPAAQAEAAAVPPLFTPADLEAVAQTFKSAEVSSQQILQHAVTAQLVSNAAVMDEAQRSAWRTALQTLLQERLQRMTKADDSKPEPVLSLVESALQAASPPEDADPIPVDPTRTVTMLQALIGWLGIVLPDAEWRCLEEAYPLPELRASVLAVWANLRDPALRSFLETRFLSTDAAELLELVPAYVSAHPDDYSRMLLELARSSQYREVFWQCMGYLSQAGVLPVEVSAARQDFTREESQRYARYTLRAALVLSEQGQCERAERVFLDVAERNLSTQGVRTALQGLANCGYKNLHRVSLGYINDPALRSVIIHLLSQHLGDEAVRQLRDNWNAFPPLTQAALLEVFQKRNPTQAEAPLTQALASNHPVVRYQAAVLTGATPLEDDLWQLVASPPAWVQQEAARAYLKLAGDRIARGESGEARRQYLALLQGGMPLDVELAAIEGLGKTGEPGDRSILEELSGEQPLRIVAQRAMAELAGRTGSDTDKAEAVGAMDSAALPQDELDALVNGISDLEARANVMLRAGFVPDGLVAGPFPQPAGTGLQQLHFPVIPYPLGNSVNYSGTDYEFKPLAPCGSGVRFDLNGCIPGVEEGAEVSAYAVYELRLPALTGVYLQIYHHAGFAAWINGKFQRSEQGVDGEKGAWYRLPAVLEPGLTYIVLKLPRGATGWRSALRVTLRDGKPLDLTRQAMPEDPLKPVGVQSREVRQLLEKLP